METLDPSVAQQIAQAATAFQQQRTGHEPKSVAVVLSGDILLVTLHGALSPAEKAMAQSPEGAAQVQEFHRQLFTDSADELREESSDHRRRGARSDRGNETTTGTVMQVFTTGTMVQVFLLAQNVPADSWSGNGSVDSLTITEVQRCWFCREKAGNRWSSAGRIVFIACLRLRCSVFEARRETGHRGRCGCSRPSCGDLGTIPISTLCLAYWFSSLC